MTFVLVSVLYKHVCECIDDPFATPVTDATGVMFQRVWKNSSVTYCLQWNCHSPVIILLYGVSWCVVQGCKIAFAQFLAYKALPQPLAFCLFIYPGTHHLFICALECS